MDAGLSNGYCLVGGNVGTVGRLRVEGKDSGGGGGQGERLGGGTMGTGGDGGGKEGGQAGKLVFGEYFVGHHLSSHLFQVLRSHRTIQFQVLRALNRVHKAK